MPDLTGQSKNEPQETSNKTKSSYQSKNRNFGIKRAFGIESGMDFVFNTTEFENSIRQGMMDAVTIDSLTK